MRKLIALIATQLATLTVCGMAPAALLVYEPFNYTNFGDPLQSKGGTTEVGLSNTWVRSGSFGANVGNASLVYPAGTFPAATTGFDAIESGNGTPQGDYSRNITTPIGDTNGASTVWFSFLINPTARNLNGSVRLNTTTLASGIQFGWGGGGSSAPGTGLWTVGGGGTTTGNGGLPTIGTTVLIVGKLEFTGNTGTDTVRMFINPGWMQPADASAVSVLTGLNFGDINNLSLHWGAPSTIDEIRIATSYEELAGVPEPASFLLAASGIVGLGLFALQRKYRHA